MSSYSRQQKWLAGSTALAGLGSSAGDPGLGRWAQANLSNTSAMAQAIAEREAAEEAEKKKKSGLFGKIGGAVAGLALAPFTGGMSLPLAAGVTGLGSAAGSALGQAVGGGGVDMGQVAQSGLMGAVGGGLGRIGSGAGAGAAKDGMKEVAAASGNLPAYEAGSAATQAAGSGGGGILGGFRDMAMPVNPGASFGSRAMSGLNNYAAANMLLNGTGVMGAIPQDELVWDPQTRTFRKAGQ